MISKGPVDATARWWPCAFLTCVCGLRRLERHLNFLICILLIDLVLKYGSDIIERNWLQLLFHFVVLMFIAAFVFGTNFFFRCFSDFRLKFSRIALWQKRLKLDSKNDLTWTALFLEMLSDYASFRRLHIIVDWNLHELLNFYPFFYDIIFFWFLSRAVFWSVLSKCL